MPKPIIVVSAPIESKRVGDWTGVDPVQHPVQSLSLSWSWGAEPGVANVVYLSENEVKLGSAIQLTLGDYFFSGVCETDIPLESSRGRNRELSFRDYRKWLDWDQAYCLFNQVEDRLIDGYRQRRYRHILPADHFTHRATWTDAPYPAWRVMQLILAGPGIGTPWSVGYLDTSGVVHQNQWHPNLAWSVMDFDCMSGKPISAVLSELCDQCGVTFTHMPTSARLFNLVFAQKGVDGLDITIPADADNRKAGKALSGNPTRVRVLGDRNLYQVHDIQLTPDWNRNWDQFYDINRFVDHVFENLVTWDPVADPEQIIARQEALAMAMSITLWEFDKLSGDNGTYLDPYKYSGRARNTLACAYYIQNILFRCFTLPSDFSFRNTYGQTLTLDSVEIADKLLTRVEYDPETGVTSWINDAEESVDGNAFVLAQGYNVGDGAFQNIRPDRFDIDAWLNAHDVWQKLQCNVEDGADPDGMSLVFDQPIIRSSDLVELVDGYAVFKANPTITVPAVKATIVFAGELFSWYQTQLDAPVEDVVMGTQINDATLNVSGLNGEFVLPSDDGLTELEYSDGNLSRTKAIAYANNFLKLQFEHDTGQFTVPLGDTAYPLTGKTDRITIDYSPSGKLVTVELTNERARQNYVPDRELARDRQLARVPSGMLELRNQAMAARMLAAAARQHKDVYQALDAAFKGTPTEQHNARYALVQTSSTTTLPVGSVIVKKPTVVSAGKSTNTHGRASQQADETYKEFVGVTTKNGVVITKGVGATYGWGNTQVQVAGEALCLVYGPVSFGDTLVTTPNAATHPDFPLTSHSFLVKSGDDTYDTEAVGYDITGNTPVGVAQQTVSSGTIELIKVKLGGGGAATVAGETLPVWI